MVLVTTAFAPLDVQLINNCLDLLLDVVDLANVCQVKVLDTTINVFGEKFELVKKTGMIRV